MIGIYRTVVLAIAVNH